MKHLMITLFLLVSVSLAGAVGVARAQSGGDYELEWATVDGGGTVSTGDNYALGGTAGQPDAGALAGGDFEVSGGFWTIKVENPTAARVVALAARSPAVSGIAAAALLAVFFAVHRRRGRRRPTRIGNE